jgi:hypothetical protein
MRISEEWTPWMPWMILATVLLVSGLATYMTAVAIPH